MSRLLLALLLLLPTSSALGHTRSHSFALWSVDADEARVELRVTKRDLTLFDPGAERAAMLSQLSLEPCEPLPESFVERASNDAQRIFRWRVRCTAAPEAIHSDFLVDQIAGHAHFVTVKSGASLLREGVLDENVRRLSLSANADDEATAQTGFWAFLVLGLEHILGGPDHLVFLLVLILVVRQLGAVALAVTGFTLGHSLTLGLAVMGWVRPEAAPVEALIGASIALVATENVWLSEPERRWGLPALAVLGVLSGLAFSPLDPSIFLGSALFVACYFGLLGRAEQPERWRFAVAALFGLVHGFGFGGVLSEMALPADRILVCLAGFNVGVELGQLAVLCVLWPLLHVLTRSERGQRRVVHWGSAVAMGLGCFWWVSRAM